MLLHLFSLFLVIFTLFPVETFHVTNYITRKSHNSNIKMVWYDTSVSLTINGVTTPEAYALFSQLDQHPNWSPWLNSVDYNRKTGISKWTLKAIGLSFSWMANNTYMDDTTIQWQSIEGFQNKGRVEFQSSTSNSTSTTMKLTLSYDLPQAAITVLESLGPRAQNFIQETLLEDLKRFRAVLLKDIRNKRMDSFRAKS